MSTSVLPAPDSSLPLTAPTSQPALSPSTSTPSSVLPYYTPSQVSLHSLSTDCWVSFFHRVYDLTSVLASSPSHLHLPLLRFAGRDISFLFDPSTRQPVSCVSPVSGLRVFSCPYGPYPHLPPEWPSSDYATCVECVWWEDERLCVGRLASSVRDVRLVNTLTGQDDCMEVAGEETVADIKRRWQSEYGGGGGYVLKVGGRVLELDKTLEQNGLADERADMEELGMNCRDFIPVIHLYFDDQIGE